MISEKPLVVLGCLKMCLARGVDIMVVVEIQCCALKL